MPFPKARQKDFEKRHTQAIHSTQTSKTRASDQRRFKIEVSGWYADEGLRRRAAEEGVYGIPLSDHSDFPSLVEFVRETSPRLVYAVYGFSERFTRHLRRLGFRAYTIPGATGLAKFF
jgi:Predicted exonuclease of the beta-lactamase fold involved in RNA processing